MNDDQLRALAKQFVQTIFSRTMVPMVIVDDLMQFALKAQALVREADAQLVQELEKAVEALPTLREIGRLDPADVPNWIRRDSVFALLRRSPAPVTTEEP